MTLQTSFAKKLFSVRAPNGPDPSTSSYRFVKRIHLPVELMKTAGICAGDAMLLKPALQADHLASLSTSEDRLKSDSDNRFAIGIAWPLIGAGQDSVVLSLDHLLSAGVQAGDLVNVIPLPPILPQDHRGPGKGIRLPEARQISLKELDPTCLLDETDAMARGLLASVHPDLKSTPAPKVNRLWEGFVREVLVDRKHIASGHYVSVPSVNGSRVFRVEDIRSMSSSPDSLGQPHSPELFVITRKTRLEIQPLPSPSSQATASLNKSCDEASGGPVNHPNTLHAQTPEEAGYAAIGGLDTQVEQIRELVELPLTRPELYSHFGLTPPRGILLYGPPGTGKTLLASIVANSTKSTLLNLSSSSISSAYHGEAEQKIYELFAEAKARSPSIIVIDEIDGLFPNREAGGEVDRRVVGAMLTCMDGIDEKSSTSQKDSDGPARPTNPRVIVIATTNRPHSIDPALRRPGRFDRELEIGIPDAPARLKILHVLLRKVPHNLESDTIKSYADKTHGFVGADLVSLVRTAGLAAIKRSMIAKPPTTVTDMKLEVDDFERALLTIRPSAMREVFIETPKVKWTDIGGQEIIKQKLRESVEWPMKYPETFKRLGINPTRGVLLYGPPGCSKTLIAKALASESGLNFISIKGSEVFNKYVGESEKSVRDLFRKARAASPSVVFLDEIDTIAISRSSDEGGGGSATGDRVLTSLLTEIDGIEELNGVLVLAATNRPDVIDAALMRPGRLDRILYVGPPDLPSRKEILKINFTKMSVAEDVDVDHLAQMTEGCTGAEIVSICQDAAMNAMHKDLNAQHIGREDLEEAALNVRRRTTPEVIQMYEEWRDRSGVRSV